MFLLSFCKLFWIYFCRVFSCFPLLFSSLVIWWLSLASYLDPFYFFLYLSIAVFWFVVLMRFWDGYIYILYNIYNNLVYTQIILSCWSLNFKCISNILHFYSLFTIAGFAIFVYGWFPAFTVCLPLPVSFPIRNFLISRCGLFFST